MTVHIPEELARFKGPGQGDASLVQKEALVAWRLLRVLVIVIAIVVSAGEAVDKAATTKHTVVYTVTGDGTADITYQTLTNGNAGGAQDSEATLPWSKTITGSGLLSIFGVNATVASGSYVTCTLTIDGKQIATNTAHGQFASADCTGSK